jgi:ADP-ribose pyrophosphatase YjhB (NUDIX family)
MHLVARETSEETNNILSYSEVLSLLEDIEPIVIKESKYALYLVEWPDDWPEITGKRRLETKKKISWIDHKTIATLNIHPRLKSYVRTFA